MSVCRASVGDNRVGVMIRPMDEHGGARTRWSRAPARIDVPHAPHLVIITVFHVSSHCIDGNAEAGDVASRLSKGPFAGGCSAPVRGPSPLFTPLIACNREL